MILFLLFLNNFSNYRYLGRAEERQLWNLNILRVRFAEQERISDAQMALQVGEFVNLRLGSSESQVIRVHGGEEERVDLQLLTPKANGKVLVYKGVSPRLSFCDDSCWVEAAAVVTGFETSEVTFHPGALSLEIYVVVKLLFYFINYVQIPERLKRMEQTLMKRLRFSSLFARSCEVSFYSLRSFFLIFSILFNLNT